SDKVRQRGGGDSIASFHLLPGHIEERERIGIRQLSQEFIAVKGRPPRFIENRDPVEVPPRRRERECFAEPLELPQPRLLPRRGGQSLPEAGGEQRAERAEIVEHAGES